MKHKIAVGGFVLCGVLFMISGLRDIFAPGFLVMSPRVMSRADIVLEFATAVIFLSIAVLSGRRQQAGVSKK